MPSPVTKNIIANIFKIFVVFTNQILLVPAYIIYLGIDLYSDWLVLSAVTSFFAISDMGLNNVTNNLFCIRFAENKKKECTVLLTNNIVLILGIMLTVIFIILFASSVVDFAALLRLHVITRSQTSIICIAFLLQIFIQMIGCVFDSIHNANHLASKATYINNFARLFYAFIIFLGLVFHFEIQIIVIFGLVPYVLILIYKYIDSRKLYNYRFRFIDLDLRYIYKLLKPSMGFMFFPIGNAILFQIFTLMVNIYFGANTLVLFNTMRTMMNFIRNVVQAISSGIKPEFAIKYGHNNYVAMKILYKKSIFYCSVAASLSILSLAIFGKSIYNIWTKGQLQFDMGLMIVFSVILFINMIWEASCITLTATNNHFNLGVIYLISCAITILVAYSFARSGMGLITVSSSLIIADVIMAYYSLKYSNSFLQYRKV